MPKEKKHIYLPFLEIIVFIVIIIWLFSTSLNLLLNNLSSVTYNDNLSFGQLRFYYLMWVIYGIFVYNVNIKTLKEIRKKNNFKNRIFLLIIDATLIPLSILIMIVYHNYREITFAKLDSLINIYVIIILFSIKHIVILIIYRRFLVHKSERNIHS